MFHSAADHRVDARVGQIDGFGVHLVGHDIAHDGGRGALGGEGRHVRSDVGGDPARRGQGESPTP
jgi:hypothetical protein